MPRLLGLGHMASGDLGTTFGLGANGLSDDLPHDKGMIEITDEPETDVEMGDAPETVVEMNDEPETDLEMGDAPETNIEIDDEPETAVEIGDG